MKNTLILVSALIISFHAIGQKKELNSISSQDGTDPHLHKKTESFIKAYSAKQQPHSGLKDIDYFLSFFADDFIDEHIKYNVIITDKEIFRKGMIDKLQNKVYYHIVSIDDIMLGKNVAFIKITIKAKVKPFHMDKVIENTSSQIMSIEYDQNGLIKHLRRHHN
ncbi:hypothetical protein [Wocania ichthyoenteri]|uniref:hypothetical protein n=1 Tax=Wocania ichthyoenteri TaxID=1230531 RepID=UPI0006914E4E|nr:hypothetical protein [Wocania ichthyoenteri]